MKDPTPPETKQRDCAVEKEEYDQCFRDWFRYSFLKKDFEDPCVEYFRDYSACLKKSLDAKGLGQLMDDSDPIWRFED